MRPAVESATITTSADVDRVVRLRAALTEQIEACRLELPLLPSVTTRVLAATEDPNTSAARLCELIHEDQALAAHLLRVANSAAFAGRSRIDCLQRAVARFGTQMLVGMAVAISVESGLYHAKGFRDETRRLWSHALASGLYAREIATLRGRGTEVAFMCGLLHRVGRPVILQAAIKQSERLQIEVDKEAILELIDELGGRAGALLATKWKLPRAVVEAIVYCEFGEGVPQCADDVYSAALASHLASHILDSEAEPCEALAKEEAVVSLGLARVDLEVLLEKRERVLATLRLYG